MSNTNTTKNTKNTKNTKSMKDNNSVVENGSIINGAVVTKKLDSAVVLSYKVGDTDCTGVMHVSQFPSIKREERDAMFAAAAEGTSYDKLEATVEGPDKSKGRQFSCVRLSGRSVLEQEQKQQRQNRETARKERENKQQDAITAVAGKVVNATLKKLAFAKDPQTKEESDHCFGAFLETDVNGVKVSGLLHTSRMIGKGRIDRLVEAASSTEPANFEVVVEVTEKGVAFSEAGVEAAKEAAAAAAKMEKESGERENFLGYVRGWLAEGSAEKSPFQAKISENRLASGGGISCVAFGCKFVVSQDDLSSNVVNHTKGIGHVMKLVAVSVEEDGTVRAKQYIKS